MDAQFLNEVALGLVIIRNGVQDPQMQLGMKFMENALKGLAGRIADCPPCCVPVEPEVLPQTTSEPSLLYSVTLPTRPMVETPRVADGVIIGEPGVYTLTEDHGTLTLTSSDVEIDLSGHHVDDIVVIDRPGDPVSRVWIHDGVVSRFRGVHDMVSVHDLELSGLSMSHSDTCLNMRGQRVWIHHTSIDSGRYCIFSGNGVDQADWLIEDCDFSSVGDESTVRLHDHHRLIMRRCNVSNGMKHCVRMHCTARGSSELAHDLALVSCALQGGNGLMVGNTPGERGLYNVTILDNVIYATNESQIQIEASQARAVRVEGNHCPPPPTSWQPDKPDADRGPMRAMQHAHPDDWSVSGNTWWTNKAGVRMGD